MDRLDPPTQIEAIGATACLAKEAVEGQQLTAEGYVFGGEVTVHSVVDSVTYPDSPSFLRYQYPSLLPDAVIEGVVQVSQRIIKRMVSTRARSTSSTSGIPRPIG